MVDFAGIWINLGFILILIFSDWIWERFGISVVCCFWAFCEFWARVFCLGML